jgi:glycosyltransferase involved in cell wall biosynthesis
MRILWLTQHVWPRELGGVELCVDILSRRMVQAGCQVEIWCSGLAEGYEQRTSDGRLLVGLGLPRVPARLWTLTPLWRMAHAARRLAGRGSADIVFCPSPILCCAALAARIAAPVVYCPGGTIAGSSRWNFPTLEIGGLRGRIYSALSLGRQHRLAERRAVRRSAGVVVVSRRDRDQLASVYSVPPRHIRVIYNGADHQEFNPAPLAAPPPDRPAGALTVLTVARLHPIKNIEHLLRAWALVRWRPRRLWIVGDGVQMESLRALAGELGIADSVVFFGAQLDVRGLLRAADVFVLPSLYEACPLALLEAMAVGLPGITLASVPGISDVAASDEINLDGQTGFVTDPRDPAALAGRLDLLAGDEPLRQRLGQAALRRVAQHFTWAQATQDYLHLARQLACGRGGPAEWDPTWSVAHA